MLAFPTPNPIMVPYMLEDLDTYRIKVGGDFTNSAPIGGTFIQGNTRLQDLGSIDIGSIYAGKNVYVRLQDLA